MNRILQVFYIFFSAALLSLSIPNELYIFGSPFIAIFSLIPFYFVFINFKSYREAAVLTGFFTCAVHLITSYWLAFFKDFAALTLGASAAGTGVIGAFIGLLLYSPFAKLEKTKKLRIYASPLYGSFIPFRILWFSFVYITYEWIKSIGWFGYPWGTVSAAMYRWKILIQIADITGTYGISFLSILFAAVISEGFILYPYCRKSILSFNAAYGFIRTALVWSALSLLAFGYGCIRYISPARPAKYLNTIMVQQNSNPWLQVNDTDTILTSEKMTLEKIEEAEKNGDSVDLVVWSEGCLKYSFPNSLGHYYNAPLDGPLIPFIQKAGIPLLTGGSYTESYSPKRTYNAALLFDREGKLRGMYGKNHLVPVAEAIPFAGIPSVASFLKKVVGISAGWTPGDQYVYFDVQGNRQGIKNKPAVKIISLAQTYEQQKINESENPYVRITAPICFDDAFPDVCRPLMKYGSEIFMNLTDDSWSKTKSSEYQHFVIAAYRAVEMRTTLARSTNSGYSAVVDPKGNILYDMPLFEESAMFCKIPVYNSSPTIYLRFGNWLPKTAAAAVILVEIFLYLTRKKAEEVCSERKKFRKTEKSHKKSSSKKI